MSSHDMLPTVFSLGKSIPLCGSSAIIEYNNYGLTACFFHACSYTAVCSDLNSDNLNSCILIFHTNLHACMQDFRGKIDGCTGTAGVIFLCSRSPPPYSYISAAKVQDFVLG